MKKHQDGYIAIASVLVITVVVLIIGTSVSILSVNDMQSALAFKKGEEALDLTEGCVENALIKLSANNALPSTIALPEGSCTITTISQVGTSWVFDTTGTLEGYVKTIRISASRTNTVAITSWTEQ